MKLFSEKVEPTFTNSTFNILQVENYSEIFFDVYEIELNKIKYPAEKISSFRGNPVVSVPVVIGEKEQEFPFVLIKGSESIFFNESNIEVPIDDTPVEVEDTDVLFESVDIDHDHRIKEDTKREIMEHIENAKVNARKQAESIKREKLKEADTEIRNKNKLLRESLDTAKQQLVKEFISITKSIKRELINEADDKYSELTLTIDNKINDLANTLAESIQSDFENSSKELETNIRAFVKAIHNESVLPELRKSLETIATDAVVRIKGIESDLDKKLTEKVDVSVIEELTSELDALRNSNIELNNTLNKGVNKALSRVGNVNNRLDEAVADITKQVDDKISATADNISSYYSDKLQVLEDQTFELNEKSRQYVVDIVRESRDNLISEIRKIQKEAPVEFVIESAGKKKTKTFDSIQKDIDKKISDRVSDEVIKLRKYIAVYSGGGGTVAQQFADGGVMNGDLIVNGDIFSNGSQVAALVDPVKTTLNGNGILSSFPISGAEGLINPSALTVAIDGVLQEPIVDYTVSGGNITFSDPIPLGCKAVIISPVNSLQISQMIPADGSVTSSKLDNSLNLAGNLTVGGNVGIGATTPTAKLNILDTTLAGSAGLSGSALNVNQTWNTNLTPTALSVNVTDLSSNASSLLMDLQVGGVSKIAFRKDGLIYGQGTAAYSLRLNADAYLYNGSTGRAACLWSDQNRMVGGPLVLADNINVNIQNISQCVALYKDAANTLAQRNGLNPQEYRLYNKFNNASDYERFFIKTNVGATSATQIGLSAAGSGENRDLEFVAGGSTKMTVSSGGNVGIGINAPTGRLHSYNTTLNNPAGYFQQTRNGGSDYGLRIVSSNTGGTAGVLRVEGSGTGNLVEVFDTETNVFVVKDGGNVGIGTSSPTEKLTVVGNISATGNVTTAAYRFSNTTQTPGIVHNGLTGNDGRIDIIPLTSGAFPMASIGNFWIASPSFQLTDSYSSSTRWVVLVADAANTLAQRNGLKAQESRIYSTYTDAANYERFFIKTNVGSTSATQIGLSAAGSGQNRDLEFVAGGSTRMTVSSGGNVGIGTTSPIAPLHISGFANLDGLGIPLFFQSTRSRFAYGLTPTANEKVAFGSGWGVPDDFAVFTKSSGDFTESSQRFTVKMSGNVGIGTNSPTEKLTVVGNISATGNITTGGGSFVITSADGTFIQSGGASNRIITSSERSIIRNLPTGGIDVRNHSDTAGTVACGSLSASGSISAISGTLTPSADGPSTLVVNKTGGSASAVRIGTYTATPSYGALYFQTAVPSATNYTLISDGTGCILNGTGTQEIRVSNESKFSVAATTATFATGVAVTVTSTLSVTGASTLARLKATIPEYANDAAADADPGLISGQLYKITGARTVYQKP